MSDLGYFKNSKLIINKSEQKNGPHLNIMINIPIGNNMLKEIKRKILNICTIIPKPIKEEVDEISFVNKSNIDGDIKDIATYTSFDNLSTNNVIDTKQLSTYSTTFFPPGILDPSLYIKPKAPKDLENNTDPIKIIKDINITGEILLSDGDTLNEKSNIVQLKEPLAKMNIKNNKPVKYSDINKYLINNDKVSNFKKSFLEKHILGNLNTDIEEVDTNNRNTRNTCSQKMAHSYPVTDVLAVNTTNSSLNSKQENVKSDKYNNSEHGINENEVIGNVKQHTFAKTKSIQSGTIRDQKEQSKKFSNTEDSLKLKKETESFHISSFTNGVLDYESLSDVSKMKNTKELLVNNEQSSNFLNTNVISVSLPNSTPIRVEDDLQKINHSSYSKHKRSDNQSFEVNKEQKPESKQKKFKFDKVSGQKQTKSKILCIQKVQKISTNVKSDIPREVISEYNLPHSEMSKHIGNDNSGGIVLNVHTCDKTREKFKRNYNTKTSIEPSDVQSLNNSYIRDKVKAESIETTKYSLNHGLKRSLLNDVNDNYHTTKKGKFQQLCNQASKRNKRLQFRESSDCFELHNNNGETMSDKPKKNTVKVNTVKQYFTVINMSIEERQDKENNQRNFDTVREDSVNTINVPGTAETEADNLAPGEINKGNIQGKSNSSNSNFFEKTNGVNIVNSNNVRENGCKTKTKNNDSSEDEGNFTDIMNYIKDYVNNETNFKLNKTKSKTYKSLVKNKFIDFETSDNYSSDSSVGEYTTHLRRKYRDNNARKNILMNEKRQFSKLSSNKKEHYFFEDLSKSGNKNVHNRRNNGTNQIELLKEKSDCSFKNLNNIDDQRNKISDKFLHLCSEKGVARNNANKSLFWETRTDKFTKKKSNMHSKLKDKNGHKDTNQRNKIKTVASSKPLQLSTPQNTVGNVQLLSETKIFNCDSNKYFNKKVNKIVNNEKLRNQTENIIEDNNLNCVKFCNENKIKISQKDKNKKITDFCQSVSKHDIFENNSSKRIKHTNTETDRFTNRSNNCSLKKVIHKNADEINQHELCTRSSSETETNNSLKPIQFGNAENNLIVGVFPHSCSKNKTLLADSILTTEVKMNGNTRNKQHKERDAFNSVEQLKWLERKQSENSKYTMNENDNSSPSSAKVNGKETQKEEQRLILSFCDRVLAQRYDNKSKSKNSGIILIDSDDSSAGYGISEFETEKDTDSEECKTKILEIISYADDELLNIVEENEQLRDLRINISWDVPISHTIETRVSSCPTKAQQQLFKDLNIQIKYGPFTKFEDDTIKENFKHFCMEHGLHYDPVPFLNFRYGKIIILKRKERIKFGRYLGRGLENRKLFCIYNRFKVLYSSFTKGRFTPEEDAVILKYMKLISDSTKQFSSLSKILHRPRPSIEKRYRLLQRGSQILKVKDYPIFVNRLMEVTNCDRLECLRDRYITDVEWKKVSKKLNVCKNHLKICWKSSLYTKIFHNGPIQVDSIMRRLLARLDETEEDDYRKLNWTKLAEPFKPVTRAFLYRIFKRVQKNKVPLYLHTNLRSNEACVFFWNKYSDWKLPSWASLQRFVPSSREYVEKRIESELKDNKLWLSVDETADRKKHYVPNVMSA